MPFYVRKSVSVGPFRFNLSNSGVGISAGVRGFRIGTGPRGSYIHVGRGGLYYRTSLDPAGRSRHSRHAPTFPSLGTEPAHALPEVETGDIMQMVDADAGEILDQINNKLATVPIWPFVALLGAGSAFLLSHQYAAARHYIGIAVLAAIGLTCLTFWRDSIGRKVVLLYDLEDAAATAFERLTGVLDSIRSATAIWNIDTHGATDDWKRTGGATHLLGRRRARVEYTTPKVIKTNVSVPAVIGGRQALYFFPDLLLVMEGSRVGGIKYSDLFFDPDHTRFIEDDAVPADTTLLGYTWKYVNKDGGPDRRFVGNKQIPVCRYQTMWFRSPSGLNKVLYISRPGQEGAQLKQAMASLAQASMRSQQSAPSDRQQRPPLYRSRRESVGSPRARSGGKWLLLPVLSAMLAIGWLLSGAIGSLLSGHEEPKPRPAVVERTAPPNIVEPAKRTSTPRVTPIARPREIQGGDGPTPPNVYVTGDFVNLRAGPSTEDRVVGEGRRGDGAQELQKRGGWVMLRLEKSGAEGWMLGRYVGHGPPVTSPVARELREPSPNPAEPAALAPGE